MALGELRRLDVAYADMQLPYHANDTRLGFAPILRTIV